MYGPLLSLRWLTPVTFLSPYPGALSFLTFSLAEGRTVVIVCADEESQTRAGGSRTISLIARYCANFQEGFKNAPE